MGVKCVKYAHACVSEVLIFFVSAAQMQHPPEAQGWTQQSGLGSGKQAAGVSGGCCVIREGRADEEGKGDNTQQIS